MWNELKSCSVSQVKVGYWTFSSPSSLPAPSGLEFYDRCYGYLFPVENVYDLKLIAMVKTEQVYITKSLHMTAVTRWWHD